MALNIKDDETDRLARELADATGESITTAARRAIEERFARVRAPSGAVASRERLSELVRLARDEVDLDQRSEAEILGYGDDGLPR